METLGKLTLTEAVQKMESINWSNHYQRPYVKVNERENRTWEVEGGFTLCSQVKVYSSTWSRRTARLYNIEGKYPLWFNLAEAKRMLKTVK